MEIVIAKEYEGKSLKEYLFGVMRLSRAQVTALKTFPGGMVLNGERVSVRAVLHEGDLLSLGLEDREECINREILPVFMNIDIAYEDEYIICVNKDAATAVHPSHNHRDDTLANGLAYYFEEKGIPFNFRAVNRLDRETSGLVMVAKSKMAAAGFSKIISSREIEKSYIAILEGVLKEKKGRISTYIKREKESIITRCNCEAGDGGDIAITDYEVLAENEGLSLVRAYPITGRTHQLRVHFSGIGCPILGDTLYGRPSELIGRQALHGEGLKFIHPFTGKEIALRGEIPDDMARIIKEKFKKSE